MLDLLQLQLQLVCRGGRLPAPASGEAPPAGVSDQEEESHGRPGPRQAQQQDERLKAEAEEVEESLKESRASDRADDPDDLDWLVVVVVVLVS